MMFEIEQTDCPFTPVIPLESGIHARVRLALRQVVALRQNIVGKPARLR